MEPGRPRQVRFILPDPNTPDHSPTRLTPSASHNNLSDKQPGDVPIPGAEARSDPSAKLPDGMPTLRRFYALLKQSKALIQSHGPYTVHPGTKVLLRAPVVANSSRQFSVDDLASSLVAARDCTRRAQREGDASSDLATFERLWHTTLSVLHIVLRTGEIDHVTFGWGIFGLCAGYIGHSSQVTDVYFLSLKTRLHNALRQFPSMDAKYGRTEVNSTSGNAKVILLTKTNREIHICATLLLQLFKREEWTRIKWYHAVAVAQRWVEYLGLRLESEAN
jgi:hypothetical protein